MFLAGRSRAGSVQQAGSDDEEDQDRDRERDQAEKLGGRETDEQAPLLAVGGSRIADRALEERAEDVADANGGGTYSDGGKARADELGGFDGFHGDNSLVKNKIKGIYL